MTAKEINRRLRGRRIVKVVLRSFDDGKGGRATDPSIYLDDGTVVSFLTQETDMEEYGVELIVSNKP